MKRTALLSVLLAISGCAALNSGHYQTDVQRTVQAVPSGKALLVVPLMGDTLYIHTIGITIFGNSTAKLKTPDFGINNYVAGIIKTEAGKYNKFDIKTLSQKELKRLNTEMSPENPIKTSRLLDLAKLQNTPYLLVIRDRGPGLAGYGVSTRGIFDHHWSTIVCMEKMTLYNVSNGHQLVSTVAIKQLKMPLNSMPEKPKGYTKEKLSATEKEILVLAKKATEDNLQQLGLIGYFASHTGK